MFKGWKLYTFREHSKGYWGFGLHMAPDGITVQLGRWGFNFYKEDD